MDSLKKVMMLLILWCGSIMVTLTWGDAEEEYDERGIEVTATITQIDTGFRGRKSYQCTYTNAQGQRVEARLTLNKFGGEVGQVVIGKYLPEEPQHVYCEASNLLKYGVLIFLYLFTLLYTYAFFTGALNNSD